jgi:hypothetical protein
VLYLQMILEIGRLVREDGRYKKEWITLENEYHQQQEQYLLYSQRNLPV